MELDGMSRPQRVFGLSVPHAPNGCVPFLRITLVGSVLKGSQKKTCHLAVDQKYVPKMESW